MKYYFKREKGEKILLEGSGVCLLSERPNLRELLSGDHTQYCKFYLTSKKFAAADSRYWLAPDSAAGVLLFPIVWAISLLFQRPLIFEVALDEMRSFTYWRKKGRYIITNARGEVFNVVTHSIFRNSQAKKLLGSIQELHPETMCTIVEGKDRPSQLAPQK